MEKFLSESKQITLTVGQRTNVLVSLIKDGTLPARARQYSDDIIKAHLRGLYHDQNIEDKIKELGYDK